jgi:hypothetical protein
MTQWNFSAVGAASIDRDLRDKYLFERRFRSSISEQESPLPLWDAPRPAPIQRTLVPEPEAEIFRVVRRIHESSHLIIGWVLGLKPKRINSMRGLAHVEWVIPSGQRAMAGFLISLAASRAGQRRWGARALDWKCQDDDEKLLRYARRVTSNEEAAQLAVVKSYEAAERLIVQYWPAVEWFAGVLERLGDHADDLEPLLRHIKPVAREDILRRRGFVSDEHWSRRGLSKPRGFDPETREIDAILSTGMAVRREDWDGPFLETLGMKPENVRMGRLNQGASVLDSHNWTSGMNSVLGGIVPGSARLEGGALVARIKFSRGSELAQRVMQDLQDGLQIPISAGYKVHRSTTDRSTNPETRTATDWEPLEVSLVPVAAEESGTGFRQIAA